VNDMRIQFETSMSVVQCAQKFHVSVQTSYGPGRRLMRGLSILRGRDGGGVEFFEPTDEPIPHGEARPSWKGGAFVPGQSKMHGATRMAVHAYVFDNGGSRTIHLVALAGWGTRARPPDCSDPSPQVSGSMSVPTRSSHRHT
jgi:hypothetical protein